MTDTLNRYQVIEQPSLIELIMVVNERVREGWIPQGGMFVDSVDMNRSYYYQAIVLPKGAEVAA